MIFWYRFENQSYSVGDEDGDHLYSIMRLHLRKMKVLRETPCGVRLIGMGYGTSNPRLVLHSHRKKFAHPTISEAALSFHCRKMKQISIYAARIKQAEYALDLLRDERWDEGMDW